MPRLFVPGLNIFVAIKMVKFPTQYNAMYSTDVLLKIQTQYLIFGTPVRKIINNHKTTPKVLDA